MTVVRVPTLAAYGVAAPRGANVHGSGAVFTGNSHGRGVEPPVRDDRKCEANGKTCEAWKKKGERFCQGHLTKKDAE